MQLQFITHFNERYSYADSAVMALEGGCRWIQLRMKDASDEQIEQVASLLKPICSEYGATFLLDDNVALVKKLDLDGVHLGMNDMPIDKARSILGPDKIIGGTANTSEQAIYHIRAGVNYLGVGPFRFTTTKKNLSPVLGTDGYKEIIARLKSEGYDVPVVAIGGIEPDDIADIRSPGVSGIALSGSILNAADPVEKTKTIISIMNNNKPI